MDCDFRSDSDDPEPANYRFDFGYVIVDIEPKKNLSKDLLYYVRPFSCTFRKITDGIYRAPQGEKFALKRYGARLLKFPKAMLIK